MATESVSGQPKSFTNAIRNVVIVGANGHIDSYIMTALLATGKHTIIALTRVSSNATLPVGVHTKIIDFETHASLTSALAGQDFLIISLSVLAPRSTQFRLIAAAADAGVNWIMPNECGLNADNISLDVDTTIGSPILAARKAILDATLSFVALSCGFCYEFSLARTESRYGFDFENSEVTF